MFKYLNIKVSSSASLSFGAAFKFPYEHRTQFYAAIGVDIATNIVGAIGGALVGIATDSNAVVGAELGATIADAIGSGFEVAIVGADVLAYGAVSISLPADVSIAVGAPEPKDSVANQIASNGEPVDAGGSMGEEQLPTDNDNMSERVSADGYDGLESSSRAATRSSERSFKENMRNRFSNSKAFNNLKGEVGFSPLYVYTFASTSKRDCGAFENEDECTPVSGDNRGDFSLEHD